MCVYLRAECEVSSVILTSVIQKAAVTADIVDFSVYIKVKV